MFICTETFITKLSKRHCWKELKDNWKIVFQRANFFTIEGKSAFQRGKICASWLLELFEASKFHFFKTLRVNLGNSFIIIGNYQNLLIFVCYFVNRVKFGNHKCMQMDFRTCKFISNQIYFLMKSFNLCLIWIVTFCESLWPIFGQFQFKLAVSI